VATVPAIPITTEAITWAYRLLLDREPESAQAITLKEGLRNTEELRREFMRSDEFRKKNALLFHLTGYEPLMQIEDAYSDAELAKVFSHVQDTWQHLGETEPHWSVLTSDEFRAGNIKASIAKFYASGKHGVARLLMTLDRNRIDHRGFQTCLEYGCGLGRVTRWLATEFPVVLGYEISKAHLRRAKEYLGEEGVRNVTFHHIKVIDDILNLSKVDLIYSVLVLQHNPPPLIELIIVQLIRALNKGGVALFQVPTYRRGYSFSLKKYLSSRPAQGTVEMHVLPQRAIFEIVTREGAQVIEVFEDSSTGDFPGISNSFLVQKNSA
jgi:SAM-dependent methyltransferase